MYTLGKMIQGRKDAGGTNGLFFSRCTEGLQYSSMEKMIAEKVEGSRDQRQDLENDEKIDGTRSAVMLDGQISKSC